MKDTAKQGNGEIRYLVWTHDDDGDPAQVAECRTRDDASAVVQAQHERLVRQRQLEQAQNEILDLRHDNQRLRLQARGDVGEQEPSSGLLSGGGA